MSIQQFYLNFPAKVAKGREIQGRPLTLTEKILWAHRTSTENADGQISFLPDRIALRDLTSQLTLLQFAASGKTKVAVPTSLHCDLLVQAETGAKEDLKRAFNDHQEIFDFLQNASKKYGIDFWEPGSGIVHQVLLENYAFPGGIIVGLDSFLPHVGGLGMAGISIGASEIVGALAGMPCEMVNPKIICIQMTGKLSGWSEPKDVALYLLHQLRSKGANGCVIEFMGEGAQTISCSGKATICNFLCDAGAVAAVFPYDKTMRDYLIANGRQEVATWASSVQEQLSADPEITSEPERYFQQIINVDLGTIEPYINGPNGADNYWPLSEFVAIVRQNGFPEKLSSTLIGSCVNSSYEDMESAVSIAKQAWMHGLKAKGDLMISPGSEKIKTQMDEEGFLKVLEGVGSTIFANACGPCAGLWKRRDVTFGERNSILTTFNKASPGRHDGNPGTHAFVSSPPVAMAMALAGRLTFNPLTDVLMTAQGLPIKFNPPVRKPLPYAGFKAIIPDFTEDNDVQITLDPDSKRLQMLKPFEPWNERDFCDMRLLVKAVGKMSVEQISPGGRWQRLRGHLENASECLFMGVGNAFRSEVGKGKNILTGEIEPLAKIARDYRRERIGWLIVAEEMCGDGSSCELSALGPRNLGCKAIVAKSFASNYESNLKRQGILALTFSRWEDYYLLREDDLVDITGLRDFNGIEMQIKHADGTVDKIPLKHSYNQQQVAWFKAGSALNAC